MRRGAVRGPSSPSWQGQLEHCWLVSEGTSTFTPTPHPIPPDLTPFCFISTLLHPTSRHPDSIQPHTFLLQLYYIRFHTIPCHTTSQYSKSTLLHPTVHHPTKSDLSPPWHTEVHSTLVRPHPNWPDSTWPSSTQQNPLSLSPSVNTTNVNSNRMTEGMKLGQPVSIFIVPHCSFTVLKDWIVHIFQWIFLGKPKVDK